MNPAQRQRVRDDRKARRKQHPEFIRPAKCEKCKQSLPVTFVAGLYRCWFCTDAWLTQRRQMMLPGVNA